MSTAFMVKFLTIAGGLGTTLPGEQKPCRASVEKIKINGMTVFTGRFVNNIDEKVTGTYTLDAIQQGSSGRSVSRQRGHFKAGAYRNVEITKTAINILPGDAYTVVLKVYISNVYSCGASIVVGAPLSALPE